MIEQSVHLASNGRVQVSGYEQLARFGYTKNRGVYRLTVTATGEWEGLTIRAFWHVPDGKDPESSLVVDGSVDVPASVTAQPGNGCITFEGSDGTKTVTSADLHYRVSANSGTEDGTEPEPGTPAWQQLVDAVHTDATAAQQAKTDAQTAASEAVTSAGSASQSAQEAADSLQELKDGIESGDFKGEPGNDGKSPVVTVTDIENGHRVSITDKDGTKTIDVLNGQTGKTGATPVLTIGTVSSGDKPSADITGTPENPVLNLRLQPGPQGPAVALDTTLTHEGEAADAKATGDAISAVKARQNVLVGVETGNPIAVDDAFAAPLCGLTVYGRSTQDGTPTPDAPVPIVSAGDGGSVAVTLSDGKSKTQTLTLPTPNGLPGIPVTSGGNYTDSTGQQWVCDEVDLERGLRVQRVDKATINSKTPIVSLSAYAASITDKVQPFRIGSLKVPEKSKILCEVLPFIVSSSVINAPYECIGLTSVFVDFSISNERLGTTAATTAAASIKAIRNWLETHSFSFSYALTTPIETPLTPAEIAAYKALTAYGPDTVVQAGDGAGVKLEYQRDVNIVIKKLEDAIASMTTT